MKTEKSENWEMWGVGIVVSLATLWALCYKGLKGDTILDSVSTIGTAVIPILAAYAAMRSIVKQDPLHLQCRKEGEAALRRLQEKHLDFLSGPKSNRDGNEQEWANRYLFFQKRGKLQKAQLMPVAPLEDGIVEIRVPRTALLIFGQEEASEVVQKEILQKVKTAVTALVEREYPDMYTFEDHSNKDVAVCIDFNESKLTAKNFGSAVEACGEVAYKVVESSLKK